MARPYEFNRKEKLLPHGPYLAVSLADARKLHEQADAFHWQEIDPAAADLTNGIPHYLSKR